MIHLQQTKKLLWAGRIISYLTMPLFIMSAVMKIMKPPEVVEGMAKSGMPAEILPILAGLEILCIVTYLFPRTAVLGAVLFTGYLGGAILAHLRLGEDVYLHIILGGLIWLGVYLQEPRLRELLPFRTKPSE